MCCDRAGRRVASMSSSHLQTKCSFAISCFVISDLCNRTSPLGVHKLNERLRICKYVCLRRFASGRAFFMPRLRIGLYQRTVDTSVRRLPRAMVGLRTLLACAAMFLTPEASSRKLLIVPATPSSPFHQNAAWLFKELLLAVNASEAVINSLNYAALQSVVFTEEACALAACAWTRHPSSLAASSETRPQDCDC